LDRYLVVLAGAGLGGRGSICGGPVDYGEIRSAVSSGHLPHQYQRAFLIGLLMTVFTERFEPHPYWRLFLVVGVLGGYTTFSSFEYETLQSGPGRRTLDGPCCMCWQRGFRLYGGLVGRGLGRPPIMNREASCS